MNRRAAFRGQPLLLLVGLIAGWLGLRTATWQPPFELPDAIVRYAPVPVARYRSLPPAPVEVAPIEALVADASTSARWLDHPLEPMPARPLSPLLPTIVGAPPAPFEVAAPPPPARPRAVVAHNLMFLAGLAEMEVPLALLPYLQGLQPRLQRPTPGVPQAAPQLAQAPARMPAGTSSRWSADGWLLLRQDSETPLISGRPSYGRSQAGAALRYRLAPASPLRPEAHLRVGAALAGAREQEAAVGVSARPVPGVPVRVAAEARLSETESGREVRPAVFAVTELAPVALPLGARGEAYLQAGYVGGRFATAFVDGQARIERSVARVGDAELAAGAGAWGGAQAGAARLDIGPSAALGFRLGEARGRVTADYRFRVAGDAEPASGPAVSLSAGF